MMPDGTLARALGLDPASFRTVEGCTHRVAILEEEGGRLLVLKSHRSARAHRREVRALDSLLHGLEARIPRLLADDETTASVLLEGVPGRTPRLDDPDIETMVEAAAAAVVGFHRIPAPSDPVDIREACARRLTEGAMRIRSILGPERVVAVLRIVETMESLPPRERVVTHGDFRPANWIVSDEGMAVIDFERTRPDVPERDLAGFELAVGRVRPDLGARFLRAYRREGATCDRRWIDVMRAIESIGTIEWSHRSRLAGAVRDALVDLDDSLS